MALDKDSSGLTKFLNFGALFECNRQFLHPLGFALMVEVQEDRTVTDITVIHTDDQEGWGYSEITDEDVRKAENVEKLRLLNSLGRINKWGSIVQPLQINKLEDTA